MSYLALTLRDVLRILQPPQNNIVLLIIYSFGFLADYFQFNDRKGNIHPSVSFFCGKENLSVHLNLYLEEEAYGSVQAVH